MEYKLSVCKKSNCITIELKDKITYSLLELLKKHNISITGSLIHIRLNDKSNVLNTFNKLPTVLELLQYNI